METFMNRLTDLLVPIVGKLTNNPYVIAIREAMMSTMGLAMVGSVFLLIANLPVPAEWYQRYSFFIWIAQNRSLILIPFEGTMNIIGIFVTYVTAQSFAKQLGYDPVSCGMLALVAFFMTIKWFPVQNVGMVIPTTYLGSKGIFMGFICAFIAVHLVKFFKEKNWEIQLPEGVPPMVQRSFSSLIPLLGVVLLFSTVHIIPVFFPKIFPEGIVNLHTLVGYLFAWLPYILDSLPGVLIYVFGVNLLWFLGLHGGSLMMMFTAPVFLMFFDANAQAFANGQTPEHIVLSPFIDSFALIGGGGGTLGFVFLMTFVAKSSHLRLLGKLSIGPSIFKINEPVIFGTPIIMNPYMMIPFLFASLITVTLAYVATTIGLVNRVVVLVPWTFPSPLVAYLSTGGDWRALVLSLVCLFISTLIYFPFFKMYDNFLLKQEQEIS